MIDVSRFSRAKNRFEKWDSSFSRRAVRDLMPVNSASRGATHPGCPGDHEPGGESMYVGDSAMPPPRSRLAPHPREA